MVQDKLHDLFNGLVAIRPGAIIGNFRLDRGKPELNRIAFGGWVMLHAKRRIVLLLCMNPYSASSKPRVMV